MAIPKNEERWCSLLAIIFNMTTTRSAEISLRALYCLTLLLTAGTILLRTPLTQSLWLDETITAWITNDSLGNVISRSIEHQGQSPLYFILVWLARKAFGSSELALRFPSIVLSFGTAAVIGLLGRILFSAWAGAFAALCYFTFDSVMVATISARPYALALFFCVCSILFLLRWLANGRLGDQLVFIGTAALTLYGHYLFAGIFAVYCAFYFATAQEVRRPAPGPLLASFIAVVCLLLPVQGQLRALLLSPKPLYFAPLPTLSMLLAAYFPAKLAIYCFGALALAFAHKKFKLSLPAARIRFVPLLIWIVFPPLLLFAHAYITGKSLFLARYFVWYTPALALLCGALFAAIQPAIARTLALAAFSLLFLSLQSSRKWVIEDWKAAAQQINEWKNTQSGPVLLYSGLIEAEDVAALSLPGSHEYFTAPFLYYPVAGDVIPIPGHFDGAERARFAEQKVLPLLASGKPFLFVAYRMRPEQGAQYAHERIAAFLKSQGAELRELMENNKQLVHVFEVAGKSFSIEH